MKKRTKTVFFLLAVLLVMSVGTISASDYLHTSGHNIVDTAGKPVWLTGINWFGFETSNNAFHGLWANDMKDLLDLIADLGFNIMRVPLHAELVQAWMQGNPPEAASVNYYQMNEDLEGKNSLEILDAAINYCENIGLKVMLDMHSVGPGTYMDNLWYTNSFTTADLIDVWKWLANRYKGNDTVIAFDLKNEPHGAYSQGSSRAIWDNSNAPNNWKKAAEDIGNAVLNINPNLLILVEGIQCYPKTDQGVTWEDSGQFDYYNTWWGGNLRGAAEYPINLGSRQNQLVYSPHDYGPSVYAQPWFDGNFTTESLTNDVWRPNWFYLYENNTAPLLVGEWGGHMDGAKNEKWMTLLRDFMKAKWIHHTFWCLNPNSGDTGGILLHDWKTITADGKLELVQAGLWKNSQGKYIGLDHEVPLGKNGVSLSGAGPVITPVPQTPPPSTPTPTPVVTPTPQTGTKGDVNGDKIINIVDALIIAQYYVGLIGAGDLNLQAADVNDDAVVNIVDALMVAQYYVGLIQL